MAQLSNENTEKKKPDRKGYLKNYHKKRKDELGITKISLVLTKEEYEIIYKKAEALQFYKTNKRKKLSLAPFIKDFLLSEKNQPQKESTTEDDFFKSKNESLKELLRLIKNCTNNINQTAYALNIEKFYQENILVRTKEEELKILKSIYSKVSEMEKLITKEYFGEK